MAGWGENVQEEVSKVHHCREKKMSLDLDLVSGAHLMHGGPQGNSKTMTEKSKFHS